MTRCNFNLTPQAQNDIQDIWLYIAKDNSAAAEAMAERFEDLFCNIGDNPYIGHKREDLTDKPVLFFPIKNYLVIYNPEVNPVNILRIVSAYRDVTSFV